MKNSVQDNELLLRQFKMQRKINQIAQSLGRSYDELQELAEKISPHKRVDRKSYMEVRIQPSVNVHSPTSKNSTRNHQLAHSLDVNSQTCDVKLPKFNFSTLTTEDGTLLRGPDPNETYVNYLTSIL